ncbi:T9SS type A sorting domain-containing protein [Aureispira anguillae]|uniref:T9SS type A sorting domain-containing protein n=1 Tax=Aureispira anguillae TaxID=2864201 RepID=A0A915YGH6_9BACT|nr:T9SS type A sorting domain-containing protein [Aureispira anguillae]BDS12607.1 T9SS type A sorting domain-containing protein [Aureispira anguillae]
MKKQTVYDRLQMQYQKLNQRIQKAMTTGRFYKYTQFKQQQLLNRLQRCSFQLKQLGAGAAVIAALGMATPAAGQVSNLVERTGANNPFDGIQQNSTKRPSFVDIDGDGDLDMFRGFDGAGPSGYMEYYENTGTVNAANFSLVQGAGNSLSGFQGPQNVIAYPSFVDIDNDGDMDVFGGNYVFNTPILKYYENTGTTTAPSFVDVSGAANPLDTIVSAIQVNGVNNNYQPFFADLDHDGDQDCLISHSTYDASTYAYTLTIRYYENTGTASVANFEERTGAANPFDFMNGASASISHGKSVSFQFADMDQDGDQDAFVNGSFQGNKYFEYYENTGTVTTPVFVHNMITPLDSITVSNSHDLYQLALVDIDGDGDQDVLHYNGNIDIRFYENLDITVGIDRVEQTSFSISPNPTTGTLSFEKAISGRLTVYTLDGKELWARDLKEEQEVDLEPIGEGLFFVRIESNKEQIVKKILIKK